MFVVVRFWLAFLEKDWFPRLWPKRQQIPSSMLAAAGFFCFSSLPVQARPLAELLDLARASEPNYLAAKANWLATQAKKRQAVGSLLPQLSASAGTNANYRNYTTIDSPFPPDRDYFKSGSAQLNLTQPLWRYASLVEVRQADASMTQAELQFYAAEQELRARVTAAWLDVLAARDTVQFNASQLATAQLQWKVANRAADLGTGGLPQAEEARARYQQAVAEQAAAEAERDTKLAALEQLAGPLALFTPATLKEQDGTGNLTLEALENWLAAADATSPRVLAAQRGLEAARAEISKQQAGHQPTLDIVGSYGNSSQTVGTTPRQSGYQNLQASIGLQLNIPIYSGGTQSAKVSEALAAEERAIQELEGARRESILSIKQAWFNARAARVKVDMARASADAAGVLLRAAQSGEQKGLKTRLEVLQAEQQLAAVQRDLRKGIYDQLAAYIRLKAVSGQLLAADIATVDARFVASDNGAAR